MIWNDSHESKRSPQCFKYWSCEFTTLTNRKLLVLKVLRVVLHTSLLFWQWTFFCPWNFANVTAPKLDVLLHCTASLDSDWSHYFQKLHVPTCKPAYTTFNSPTETCNKGKLLPLLIMWEMKIRMWAKLHTIAATPSYTLLLLKYT